MTAAGSQPIFPALFGHDETCEGRFCIDRIRFTDPGTMRVIAIAKPVKGHQIHFGNSVSPEVRFHVERRGVTLIGSIDGAASGIEYQISGRLRRNERFESIDLLVESYQTIIPETTDGIIKYLSEVGKWVAIPTARMLVKAFGMDTISRIKESPEAVAATIPGLTLERANELRQSVIENQATEAAMVELYQILGSSVPKSVVTRAVKKWKSRAAAKIRRNPFLLMRLRGVGFATADAVRRRIGIAEDDAKRRVGALVEAIRQAIYKDGSTWVGRLTIEANLKMLVGTITPHDWALALRARHIVEIDGTRSLILGGRYTLPGIHKAERLAAARIANLMPENLSSVRVSVSVDGLNQDQTRAVSGFCQSKVFILTGPPGTGKTYTLSRILASLEGASIPFAVVAPTGKAAKRCSEMLGQLGLDAKATTIHRLLGLGVRDETDDEPDDIESFSPSSGEQLRMSVLVIEESSMVDIPLLAKLLHVVPNHARVLIVGDHFQLPSVGPGAGLRDLLAAGVPAVTLSQIMRNSGSIVRLCHAIKDGNVVAPDDQADLIAGKNWRHIDAQSANEVLETIMGLYEPLAELGFSDTIRDIQVTAPLNERGRLSVDSINRALGPILNPTAEPIEGQVWRVGDKIVQSKKNKSYPGVEYQGDEVPDLERQLPIVAGLPAGDESRSVSTVNGDMGILRDYDKRRQCAFVEFFAPARLVRIPVGERTLFPAWCMTCHKLQGSEYPVVIVPIHPEFARSPVVNREWVYTAFSRAKTLLITVGHLNALPAIARRKAQERKTMLSEFLTAK